MRANSLAALPIVLILGCCLIASSAGAYTYGPYGCNLRWDQCYGDGGAINKNFACNVNTGTETLVASFVPAWDIVGVYGIECLLNIAADAPAMPAWWQFNEAGTCRQSLITANFANGNIGGACPDWTTLAPSGGLVSYAATGNTARVVTGGALAFSKAVRLVGRQEYFAFNLIITNAKSVGGSCGGCSTPVCIVFSVANLRATPVGNSRWLTGPANQVDSDHVTWQGGGDPSGAGGVGCPAATPTKHSTWGEVKSLYR